MRQTGIKPTIGRTNEGRILYTAIVNMSTSPDLKQDETGKWFYKGAPIDPNIPLYASAKADYNADSGSQAKIQSNLDAAAAFSRVVEDNSKLLEQTLGKIPRRAPSSSTGPCAGWPRSSAAPRCRASRPFAGQSTTNTRD